MTQQPQHTFTMRYQVTGRSLYDQMVDLANDCDFVGQHEWIDSTAIDSPDYTYICAGCGLTKTEPKTHWPLYPHHA